MSHSSPASPAADVLAQQLVALAAGEALPFLRAHKNELSSSVAWELKARFDRCESSDPAGAIAIARLLGLVAEHSPDPECAAVAAWTQGMADQLQGDLPASLDNLRQGEALFLRLDQPVHAAGTQISLLFSLAMLGRYAEALRTGLSARAVFLAHDDLLAAGKIEQNLGNIHFRRDEHRKAEQFYRTARKRFLALNDDKQLAQIDNCLASALTWQHKFAAAQEYYRQALARAEAAGLAVTQAEIESNLGGLMLFQGRYDCALDYLERARRRYAALGLEQDAAISEKELAEAYLELNLIPEALALLQRLLPSFEAMGLQADLAAAFTGFARACLGSRRLSDAAAALATARALYGAEQNELGVAHTQLVEAQRLIATGNHRQAAALAEECERAFVQGDAWEWLLRAWLLRGEAWRSLGDHAKAESLFTAVLAEAKGRGLPQIELHALSALGALALERDEPAAAEGYFGRALAQFELLRALLPSEEFRISFRSGKTELFDGLIALALAGGRTEDALHLVERSRSLALLELVDGSIPATVRPRDEYEAHLLEQLAALRSELNWFYHQLHRLPGGEERPGEATLGRLREGAHNREQEIAEIVRRLQQRSDGGPLHLSGVDLLPLRALQQMLGPGTAVVEYHALHGRLLAFVVTDQAVHLVENIGQESAIARLVSQLRFQIDALRGGSERMQRHMAQLTARCDAYLRQLHAALLQPVWPLVAGRRLAIVPCGALHYLPFHALRDETGYLIAHTEVCVAPSAALLHRCLAQERAPTRRALLAGAADERTPYLVQEIEHLQRLFPAATALVGEAATLDAVRCQAPAVDVLHLACHGYFRPDNPLFSALRLADGWLTVRDAYDLRLNCTLVTLSACDTGLNAVTPGEELLGLVRGFLAAGAPSLLVSLWPVDDATTVQFMRHFYTAWLAGARLAEAHRSAQLMLLATAPHPFFWSPFVLFGRWD